MLKYYVLTVNALINLLEKIKQNKQIFNASSFSKLYKFHFLAKFCSNLVFNTINTETKSAIFGLGYEFNQKRDEDAVAEMFIYEAMRTFGDRMLRPSARNLFLEQLSKVV